MSSKIVGGPFNRGLRNDVTAFNLDNNSFYELNNAYQWRGRVKRKRGTSILTRLTRFLGTTDGSGNFSTTILPTPLTSGKTIIQIGDDIFTDSGDLANPTNLLSTNIAATGTLDRSTGSLTITGSIATTSVFYIPSLAVMGLEDLILSATEFPKTIAFDTRYSYELNPDFPYDSHDVTYFKNEPTGRYPSYVQKTTSTPFWFNGQDYQQFYTTTYQSALWETNGIGLITNTIFNPNSIGMQFAPALDITYNSHTATTITLTISDSPLVVGDFVFLNEWTGTGNETLNFQTGYVTAASGANPNVVTINLPNANVGAGPFTPGIVQYLTNVSDSNRDCIKWYDGDPTNFPTSESPPTPPTGKGWVNFCPPLSQLDFSISNNTPDQYYLVGARLIVPFKDRLLFFGPVIQTSSEGSQLYLRDTFLYSQNGTAYYTASFQGSPLNPTNIIPILTPRNLNTNTFQTASPSAWFEDQVGFGGFNFLATDETILTIGTNEDVLIMGTNRGEYRLVFTGNDLSPFVVYLINSELGVSSTFSTINFDEFVMNRGPRGITITSQTQSKRNDLEIPDEIFQLDLKNNGNERFTSKRDFENEWIYYTYNSNKYNKRFPNKTLLYNYRDNSWGVFIETYTHYGQFIRRSGLTWSTIGSVYPTWSVWNTPWNAGYTTVYQPDVIAGNQQGYIVFRSDGDTGESISISVSNIDSTGLVTSPFHNLNNGDYIIFKNAQGPIASQINNKVFKVRSSGDNTFRIDITETLLGYLGGASIVRMYVPFIQTKQFPTAWSMGRKTRLGVQQYILSETAIAQCQLLIYLSQNAANPSNDNGVSPDLNTENNSLIYSTTLYTCAESTNLGLTPVNVNLQQMNSVSPQNGNNTNGSSQIWHRVNTSLIGDTVQLALTLSDEQMRDPNLNFQFAELELHGFILDVSPSGLLS